MTTKHHRQTAAELGIWDSKAEARFLEIMQQHDTDIELERARVSEREWALEHQLMMERMK